MTEVEIRDKAIEDCAKELLRKAQIADDSAKQNLRIWGAADESTINDKREAAVLKDAARHLMTMKSDSPIMEMMKGFRG